MTEHDAHVGQMLTLLDELGIADDTIVIWSSDNGAEVMSWPDGGTTPFRGEKNTNWEGGYRVPLVVRWPGVIKPGTKVNDIISHEDWVPTLMAAVGEPGLKDDLLKGSKIGGTEFKVHIDGYNLMPAFQGQAQRPRKEFLYWTDDGNVAGLRYDRWKLVFMEQRCRELRSLGRAARHAAHAEAVRPARRSVRARRPRRHRLQDVAVRAHLPAGAGAGLREELARELQGVPAAPEAGQLQPERRDGQARRVRGLTRATRASPHRNPAPVSSFPAFPPPQALLDTVRLGVGSCPNGHEAESSGRLAACSGRGGFGAGRRSVGRSSTFRSTRRTSKRVAITMRSPMSARSTSSPRTSGRRRPVLDQDRPGVARGRLARPSSRTRRATSRWASRRTISRRVRCV